MDHYIPLESAREELLSRQSHPTLQADVEAWWNEQGWGTPTFPGPDQRAILTRQVATARYEDRLFQLMAQRAGLTPVWLPYYGDTWSEVSPYKRSLVNRRMCDGRGRNRGWRLRRHDLTNPSRIPRGTPLHKLRSGTGGRIINCHASEQDRLLGRPHRQDMTVWLKQIGGARDYYRPMLSWFICHGVLFEDYAEGESGATQVSLTSGTFGPAFDAVTDQFGHTPLIVRMPWRPELAFYPDMNRWRDDILTEGFADLIGS